jgi:hypothetical protein
MILRNLILNNLLSSNEIEALISLVKKKAKVSNIIELNNFLNKKSFQEIELFQVLVKSEKLFIDIGDNVLQNIENNLNLKIKKFPVMGIRIINGKNQTLSPWHQDEGTWSHHEYLSNQNPYTCWIPIKANTKNTLQVCLDNIPLKKHYRNDLKQSVASFDNEEIKNNIIIDPVIGSGYLFSPYQPHRSYNVGNPQDIRISIDFRFTILSN